MNDLSVSINPAHYALLVLVLNGLGAALKAIPAVKNELIPVLLAGFGGLAHGFLAGWTPVGVLVGVAAGFAAVGGHQLLKSMKPDQIPPAAPLVALCLALFTGCATSGTGEKMSPARVERSLDAVVGIYATIEIRDNPKSRVKFESALLALNTLVSSERWDVAAFGEVLAATGATKLSGDEIVLIVEAAGALVELTGKGEAIDLKNQEYARAVIVAGQKALTRVLSRP